MYTQTPKAAKMEAARLVPVDDDDDGAARHIPPSLFLLYT